MTSGPILLIGLLAATARLAAQDTLRVLFIGNSHTYVNNLPALVEGLAAAGGHPLVTERSAIGGYTLCQHADNPLTLAKLAERPWDQVVLQEQSQVPVIPYWRETCMVPGATRLDSLVHVQGARSLLYMTWGWEMGGRQCVQDSCSIEFRDFQHMQDSLSSSYRRLAVSLQSGLAPVGEVWSHVLEADPFAPLWAADGYHPALEGSYLAACTLYLQLFEESPAGLDFHAGLEPERALWLQQMATEELELPDKAPRLPLAPPPWTCHPNPFNPTLTLSCLLPRPGRLTLEAHNARGERVALLQAGERPAGRQVLRWEAGQLAGGCYWLSLCLDGEALGTQAVTRLP